MRKGIFSFFVLKIILSSEIISQNFPNPYPFHHIDVLEYKIDIDLTESFFQKKNILFGSVNILCRVDTSSIERIYLDAVSLYIDSLFIDNEKSGFNLTEKTSYYKFKK